VDKPHGSSLFADIAVLLFYLVMSQNYQRNREVVGAGYTASLHPETTPINTYKEES